MTQSTRQGMRMSMRIGTAPMRGRHTEPADEARSALLSARSSRQGEVPAAGCTTEALSELSRLGLIGPGGGLTRSGSIMRDKILAQQIGDLF
jgi:hypothetical protein